ncbi:MAG: NAD(P)H-dependent oxidoreductase subunit E [Dehalococcoidales bacterium]|nr:NAD(P)H-dependent oxidoreductase subunit E [Dehalococcoidales bacterium]
MKLAKKDDNGNLLSALEDVQREFGYLTEEKLREVANKFNMPLIEVYGVATFYKSFSLTPRGRHQIKVCSGTACHVRGSNRIIDGTGRKLGIKPGETSEDGQFSLETVRCLGCCAIGPVVVADGKYYGQTTPAKVESILKTIKD